MSAVKRISDETLFKQYFSIQKLRKQGISTNAIMGTLGITQSYYYRAYNANKGEEEDGNRN